MSTGFLCTAAVVTGNNISDGDAVVAVVVAVSVANVVIVVQLHSLFLFLPFWVLASGLAFSILMWLAECRRFATCAVECKSSFCRCARLARS